MALQQARILPSITEKRYYTLQLLEAAVISGNKVKITPVHEHSLSDLSSETFVYDNSKAIETFIIFNERPKVNLLKSLGWYREDGEVPIIATIPTHILREYDIDQDDSIVPGDPVNFYVLRDTDIKELVHDGRTQDYILDSLPIIRGTKIDIEYDFLPQIYNPATDEYINDPRGHVNTFFVADVKVDTVSLNYTVKLIPYRHSIDKASLTKPNNEINMEYLNFDSSEFGL